MAVTNGAVARLDAISLGLPVFCLRLIRGNSAWQYFSRRSSIFYLDVPLNRKLRSSTVKNRKISFHLPPFTLIGICCIARFLRNMSARLSWP